MLAETTPQDKTFQQQLDELDASLRDYWLFEAQFGPIPQEIAKRHKITQVDQLNAQLANCQDYADFLAQSATGIPMF